MKIVLLVIAISIGCSASSYADCLSSIDQSKLLNKIVFLHDSYGDVRSRVKCYAIKSRSEKLICSNDLLQAMELFDAMSEVYAEENATKSEVNHKKQPPFSYYFISETIKKCKSENCIWEAYKKHANEDFNPSPY